MLLWPFYSNVNDSFRFLLTIRSIVPVLFSLPLPRAFDSLRSYHVLVHLYSLAAHRSHFTLSHASCFICRQLFYFLFEKWFGFFLFVFPCVFLTLLLLFICVYHEIRRMCLCVSFLLFKLEKKKMPTTHRATMSRVRVDSFSTCFFFSPANDIYARIM